MAAVSQPKNDTVLLSGRDPAEQVRLLQASAKRFLTERFDLGAGQHPADRNAEFSADMLRHPLVVAAEDLEADTLGPKRGDGRPGACFWRIEEDDEAGKNQILFIGHSCPGTVGLELAPGDDERAKSLRAEPFEDLRRAGPRRVVERQKLRLAGLFVTGGELDDVFGSTLGAGGPRARRAPKRGGVESRTVPRRSWPSPRRATGRIRRSRYRAGFSIRPGNAIFLISLACI